MTNTDSIDLKMQKLLEKKQALAEKEKAIKDELRELEKRKNAAARKQRNKDMILFATSFFQKSRLDHATEYEEFVRYLEDNNLHERIIADFRKQQGGSSNE